MARVLISDDSGPLRLLTRRTLQFRGHEVLEARDGDEALRVLRREQPDVAILDVVMPGLSGLDICRAVRSEPGLAAIGLIILSANASSEHARLVGADRFIAKPFLPSELLAAVDEVGTAHKQPVAADPVVPEQA